MYVLLPKAAFQIFIYFTAAGVTCRVAAVKHRPVLHHSADYIFITFRTIEPNRVILKFEYHLSLCWSWTWEKGGAYAASRTTFLHIKRRHKTESPIFVYLCVLSFQIRPFRFLFYFTAVGVKYGAVKRHPYFTMVHLKVNISFGIIEPILIT